LGQQILNFVLEREIDVQRVVEAAYDYQLLLSKGYSYSQVLNLVVQRYMLTKHERLLLFRCVHSITYTYEACKKMLCNPCRDETKHEVLVLDFYNILLTLVAMLKHDPIFLCDDCLVRDLRGSKLRPAERTFLTECYNILSNVLQRYSCFKEFVIVADKSVSHSLEDVKTFVAVLSSKVTDAKVSYVLTANPDATVINFAQERNCIVVSTDFVIIEKSSRILPLTTLLLSYTKTKPLIDFSQLFGIPCPSCI